MSFINSITELQRKLLELFIGGGVTLAVILSGWTVKTTNANCQEIASIRLEIQSMQKYGSTGLVELTKENSVQHKVIASELSEVRMQVSAMAKDIEWLVRSKKQSMNSVDFSTSSVASSAASAEHSRQTKKEFP